MWNLTQKLTMGERIRLCTWQRLYLKIKTCSYEHFKKEFDVAPNRSVPTKSTKTEETFVKLIERKRKLTQKPDL